MSCCGKNRQQHQGTIAAPPANNHPASLGTRPAPRFTLDFEYTGPTGMTVVGGITGKRYRFDAPGARVSVDVRDRRSVAAVPNLRQVN